MEQRVTRRNTEPPRQTLPKEDTREVSKAKVAKEAISEEIISSHHLTASLLAQSGGH